MLRTPLRRSEWLSTCRGGDVSSSSKRCSPPSRTRFRGASERRAALLEAAGRSRPTRVTASAGNHGRALAHAGGAAACADGLRRRRRADGKIDAIRALRSGAVGDAAITTKRSGGPRRMRRRRGGLRLAVFASGRDRRRRNSRTGDPRRDAGDRYDRRAGRRRRTDQRHRDRRQGAIARHAWGVEVGALVLRSRSESRRRAGRSRSTSSRRLPTALAGNLDPETSPSTSSATRRRDRRRRRTADRRDAHGGRRAERLIAEGRGRAAVAAFRRTCGSDQRKLDSELACRLSGANIDDREMRLRSASQ